MLTAEGCRGRRRRLLDRLRATDTVRLAHPVHLAYFAGFHVEPFSIGAGFGGVLDIRPDGHATLYHDNRLPKSAEVAHADERAVVPWYDGQSPGRGPRAMLLRAAVPGGRVRDALDDSDAATLFGITSELRRRKDPDELHQLRACMRATEAGHDWARANLRTGMTELDVYAGVCGAVYAHLGRWAVVYGDFTVADGVKRGGPPTPHVLAEGETFILDFSVVLDGYRSDFTNTLVVGGRPTADQQRLFDLCVAAMRAGEGKLKAGESCQAVYDAVRRVFEAAGVADHFPHHAGHGLGLEHPEAPFLVRHSTETLVAGDVVTLEPGLYVGPDGVRIEHNYLVTDAGFERLSDHVISVT